MVPGDRAVLEGQVDSEVPAADRADDLPEADEGFQEADVLGSALVQATDAPRLETRGAGAASTTEISRLCWTTRR